MPRAVQQLRLFFKWRRWNWFWCPRPGYCRCCDTWAWLTNERPAYSAYDGAFLCEDCADDNDKETDAAWADYYAGRL